ncbi:Glycine betaine transporter BetL [Marinomonas gallaica]|uniref:Glycine betaine transporter BetL n=1 Tax=Marinomonas gallaica TaxID=1806667 RepID=A0A1C3JPK3_9GAMM|nr:BCCT family transporter [Marinomonas gallaica]SBT17017.1 Glycine betaine transporter BetL [Marinomonas gallaica]SBT20676.1 Glycine betaine transporter BetL [Marinomonas gallaica]
MLKDKEIDALISQRGMLKGLNTTLGITALIMVVVFILYTVLLGEIASQQFIGLKSWIEETLGWYYILVMLLAFVVCATLMVSKVGAIRLGRDNERPEFSNFAWFSMLFGCGTGAGMLFFSMSEPMIHFASGWSGGNPFMSTEVKAAVSSFFEAKQVALAAGLQPGDVGFPIPNDLVAEAAVGGLTLTVFHWGAVAWSMYAIVGLSLAYFSFRKGLPLSIRSALYPLIGNRIYGPIGHAVDILAVFGTIFGIATTLGLGVEQISSGLISLNVLAERSTMVTVLSIVFITLIATLSATSGVAKGINMLSQFNSYICIAIILYFLIASNGNYLIANSLTTLGDYASQSLSMTLWTARSSDEQTWQGGWTIFYWGWWIAWSAFVGMFIARISRGRTIREFVMGVVFIPTLVSLVWFSVIGSAGIHASIYGSDMSIYNTAVNNWDYAGTLFTAFEVLTPGVAATIAKVCALVVVVVFFVTAADSGTLVLGRLLSFGRRPPIQQRILWGSLLGVVTLMILLMGGNEALKALQAASIAGALPFTFVIIAMIFGLVKSLRKDSENFVADEEQVRKIVEREIADLS